MQPVFVGIRSTARDIMEHVINRPVIRTRLCPGMTNIQVTCRTPTVADFGSITATIIAAGFRFSEDSCTATVTMPAAESIIVNGVSTLLVDNTNNRALENFFSAHEKNAYYVAYAALWQREAALDVVQESMTSLVEYYRDKPDDQWPALFRTILNSKINDARRRRLAEQGKLKLVSLTGLFRKDTEDSKPMEEFEYAVPDRDDGITAPEADAMTAELRDRISAALTSLSERQRQVFILREWRGMTIRETSQTLGCSENSVKQHHFRALRELRKQLAEVWAYAQPDTS